MNKERRKLLNEAQYHILDALELIEEARDGEQDAYDNLPENFQYGERGEQMSEYIDILEELLSNLEDSSCNLGDIVNA